MRPMVKRNQPSSASAVWAGGVQTTPVKSSRLRGPCTETLCSWSVEERTQALRPCFSATSRSQGPQ